MDHIVVDLEIKRCIGENGMTWNDTDKVGISCACVWEYKNQRMRIYGPNSERELKERVLCADRVSGFNIWKFDLPVIWGLPSRELPPLPFHKPCVNDIFLRCMTAVGASMNPTDDEIKKFHQGWSLNEICSATLGIGKIGHGAEAPKWFQAGEWWRVANYCADDVALERDLIDFVDRHGYVISGSRRLVI